MMKRRPREAGVLSNDMALGIPSVPRSVLLLPNMIFPETDEMPGLLSPGMVLIE